MSTIPEFLLWLTGAMGATFVFSYVAERWAWFQAQSVEAKQAYSTVGATVIAVLAYVTYTYVPAEVWVSLSPYWQIVVAIVTANYGSEMFHKYDKTLPSK